MTFQKMLEWKTVDLDGHPIATSLTPDETATLQELAKGKNVLEIGSGYGYSAIAMAKTAKHVTAIDPHAGELADSYEVMRANLALHKVAHKVDIIRGYSQDWLPRLIGHRSQYGLIFVDGNHDEQVYNDVHLSRMLLTPQGHIACHDYYEFDFPEIAKVLDELGEPTRLVDTLWVS